MKIRASKLKVFGLITLGFIFLMSVAMNNAEAAQSTYPSSQNRVSFALKGGFAHSESCSGMADVKAEVLFLLSSHVRAGLGIGYLSDSRGMHMGGGFGGMSGGMMGGLPGDFSDLDHDFRAIPLTLSLYYSLPVNPNLDVFMIGGAGYYLSTFRDISTQRKNAFGPHLGIGFDFILADRVMIIAEGIYRFVNLKNFTGELRPGFREEMGEHMEGFWHLHHGHGELHFHEEHEDQAQMMADTSPFNISLNGFSIRAGIKFGF